MLAEYLLILGIGHLLGDFYFQSEKIAIYKDEKYAGVVVHSLVYYIVVLFVVLPFFSIDMVLAVTYMALTHFLVDSVKYHILKKQKGKKGCWLFVADQIVHIICILVLAYIMNYWNFELGSLGIVTDFLIEILGVFRVGVQNMARWLFAILFVGKPVNIFIQEFFKNYGPIADKTIIKADNKAGRKIGTVERFIMLIFVSFNQYVAMGFILTAKSVARYDKISKDEKFAEYYLLGTLTSTLSVLMCKLLILA